MKSVTCDQIRALDRRTMEAAGIPGEVLMDRAGKGIAETILDGIQYACTPYRRAILLAGRGNNGGDAFVAARYLQDAGLAVEVWLIAESDDLRGDARIHFDKMRAANVPLREMPAEKDLCELSQNGIRDAIIVDGLLGTGISGEVRGPIAEAIRFVNELSSLNTVVAIDIPSGLNGDTGDPAGEAVRADVTVTMALPKRGMLLPHAMDYVGCLHVVDIGIPDAYIAEIDSEPAYIAACDVEKIVSRRKRNTHKGSYGSVLIVAGGRGFAGAAGMAGCAAVRSGAGRVTILTPASIAATVAKMTPECMVYPAVETEGGGLSSDCLDEWGDTLDHFNAVLVGPGITQSEPSWKVVEWVLARARIPVVLDADALNVSADKSNKVRAASCPVILTPHPGEMARLLACTAADIQADRWAAARKATSEFGATIVLKGAGTVIVKEDAPLCVNMTGNPGMATGGTGDVLAGLLAGLLAQGIDDYDASRVAVYLHGRAGDIAALRYSQAGLAAGDVIAALGFAWREIAHR